MSKLQEIERVRDSNIRKLYLVRGYLAAILANDTALTKEELKKVEEADSRLSYILSLHKEAWQEIKKEIEKSKD